VDRSAAEVRQVQKFMVRTSFANSEILGFVGNDPGFNGTVSRVESFRASFSFKVAKKDPKIRRFIATNHFCGGTQS